ncbi:tyrosinase family oxidase copper chaperone [Streptomyces sp. NPDC051018]|uniref:tyrosinase family oxidase copper chaperone n=1 Tax=Streptomyces sp. NPDC051018 TaxID=3365639 RepID=UPI0037B04E1F
MRFPDRHAPRRVTRRIALRALFTSGVVAGTAGALVPLLGNGDQAPAVLPGEAGEPGPRAVKAGSPPELERFAEMYRGRHIQGTATVMVPAGGAYDPRGVRPAAAPSVEVRIDGRPLHIMRRADGSYLSLVNHYESFPTLREVARAAVDELGAAQLSMSPSHGH